MTWLLSPLSLFVTTEVVKKNYHKTFAIKRSFSGASSSVNFSGHTAKTVVKQKNLTFLSISDPCDLTFNFYICILLDANVRNLADVKGCFHLKSNNLQYNMIGCWVDGPNDSLTKRLMFQVLFFS